MSRKFKSDDERRAMFYHMNHPSKKHHSTTYSVKSSTKGITTARGVIPEYQRPDYHKVDKENAESFIQRDLKDGSCKKLGNNMWVWNPKKFPYEGCHKTVVFIKTPDGYYRFNVPTDKSGKIPERVACARLLDTFDGDRQHHFRSVMMDVGINAEHRYDVSDKEHRADIYRWYIYPNESDIVFIDDKQTKILEILKETKTGRRTVLISGGTEEQRNALAESIENNFTIAEKRIIAGNMITIGNTPVGVAGYYSQQTDSSRHPIGCAEIRINSSYATKEGSDVVIHECIHLLRDHDEKRDPHLRATKAYIGRDADLEESMTEAETVSRQKPLTKDKSGTGYYRYVKTTQDKTTSEIIKDDRIIVNNLTEDNFREIGKKGKSCQKAVLTKYPDMNISKLKYKGDVEAIDSYYKLENRKGKPDVHIQTYAPNQTDKGEKKEDELMKKSAPIVKEWKDKKLVKI